MTFEQLQQEPQHLLLKCLSGSRAYNLQIPSSDTDYKGIFILPQKELYGLSYTPQVANASNDEVFFEAGRLIELLCRNNPNILELLATSPDCTLYRHPLMELLQPDNFLSRLCRDSFAGYALTQVKKAKGLNKKINNPITGERKTVIDFCWVYENGNSVPLKDWMHHHKLAQEACGLSRLPHFRDSYLLFTSRQLPATLLKGIISGPQANEIQLSGIPAGVSPEAVLHFNKDGYSIHCREYKEYQEWLTKRNEHRYQETLAHAQHYDTKHMMHTFRLLSMAEEIARYKKIIVKRPDRDFLLSIRNARFSYEDLLQMIEEKMEAIDECYAKSDLPDTPDTLKAEQLLIEIRDRFYKTGSL